MPVSLIIIFPPYLRHTYISQVSCSGLSFSFFQTAHLLPHPTPQAPVKKGPFITRAHTHTHTKHSSAPFFLARSWRCPSLAAFQSPDSATYPTNCELWRGSAANPNSGGRQRLHQHSLCSRTTWSAGASLANTGYHFWPLRIH